MMANARRVVLDTNSVVSALLFVHGRLAPLRTAWQSGAVLPLLRTRTTQELLRVLTYPKFRLSADERDELLADYLPYAEVVGAAKSSGAAIKCRDPHDQPFLDLATTGKAKWLVTGDQDLLALAGRVPFQIITPAEAIALLAR